MEREPAGQGVIERGAISQLQIDRGAGRIARLRFGGQEINFNARVLEGVNLEQLQIGQLVDFEVFADQRRGLRALRVSVVHDELSPEYNTLGQLLKG